MVTKADWFVVAGFLLAVLGLVLRTIVMMRANDARPVHLRPLYGAASVRAFRSANPSSWMPAFARLCLASGLILLIAGFLLEYR